MTARRKPKPKPPPRYEYRIQYRRRWAPNVQVRFYQTPQYARRLVDRLRGRTRHDLEPLVELYVDRRVVGEWKPFGVDRLTALDDGIRRHW